MVMTRDQGVRKENPLLKDDGKYYSMNPKIRNPAMRKEADALLMPKTKLGLKIRPTKRVSK